jgi:hypothetical protein
LVLLFIAGFVELSFNFMAQGLVQLNAPAPIRGRVMGVFSMAASGMRTFSGLTVGMMGGFIGIHHSLPLSAAALFAAIGCLMAYGSRAAKRSLTSFSPGSRLVGYRDEAAIPPKPLA